jgi:putative addiction module component (TIGR02574 family)
MSTVVTYEEVLRTAQSLNEAERVRLVEELLGTLTSDKAEELDDTWLFELDRRSGELDAGTVQAVPWNEVQTRARERAKLSH